MMIDSDPVIELSLFIWLTFFGMCIGSFLNVVIYRLPRGKSLSNPPSHCPQCHHPIRWYDNVPVFGWIFLRGKCRDCKEPINIRYPIVEALCGCIFGTISLLALDRNCNYSIIEFFCFVVTFSGLVVTFAAAGFIEQERKTIPTKLFIPIAIPAFIMPYFIQYSFHLPLFAEPIQYIKTGNESIALSVVFLSAMLCSIIAVLFSDVSAKTLLNVPKKISLNSNLISRIVSGILIGLYLGVFGIPVLICFQLLFFCVRKTPLRTIITAQQILSFTTFVGIILILILFR
ncbi:MAG: prepilin peptidase [Planctomycetaceae bacterium]|jgi:prepilin signal peptidase PulO-like enzyme (type II secretory pathway)|nr:prepilin peptidase [Planctomycetaceae bacterium]